MLVLEQEEYKREEECMFPKANDMTYRDKHMQHDHSIEGFHHQEH